MSHLVNLNQKWRKIKLADLKPVAMSGETLDGTSSLKKVKNESSPLASVIAPLVDAAGPPAPADVASDPEDVVVTGVIEAGPPVPGIISATNEIHTPLSEPSHPVVTFRIVVSKNTTSLNS
jgi:hypothetical protein